MWLFSTTLLFLVALLLCVAMLENIPHEGKPLVTLVKIPAKCLGSITFI